ncbi:ROK family protein [Flavobacterium granuli]|uniref:Glucokinase n=1 Tax=Flavobacterium granuli TaxID=280093 RepID=A0A1M5M1E2_9FLAO|nr:ROK family protein [Flavobacterium granuli]PRZ24180.1 glucokinase [Flavobacterium granuli]SHG71075.1 glucokinase [Flavobacterium granuli]
MKNIFAIGLDIGGSHITAGVIAVNEMKLIEVSLYKESFDSNLQADQVMDIWERVIRTSWKNSGVEEFVGISVCMPGPFDYANGICWIKGQTKYEHFYGLDVRKLIRDRLNLSDDFPVLFENDADCFGKGEVFKNAENRSRKVMAVTLGTGLGACFIDKAEAITTGNKVPTDGELYNSPYKDSIAEDYVSARGLIAHYQQLSGRKIDSGLEIFNLATAGDEIASEAFRNLGEDLAVIVAPWLKTFEAECFIIGGKIANASVFFLTAFEEKLKKQGCEVPVLISSDNEIAALLGATSLIYKEYFNQNESAFLY